MNLNFKNIQWSILIITTLDNKSNFNYLYNRLQYLINKDSLEKNIEVLYNIIHNDDILDNRIMLIDESKGKYISFIPDDADISDNFIRKIYEHLIDEQFKNKQISFKLYDNGEFKLDNFYIPIRKNKIDVDYYDGVSNIEDIYELDDVYIFNKTHTTQKPFSIIVTAYNVENYIEECLDSIENQSYFLSNNNFEILVGVDNCISTLNKIKTIKHKYRNLSIFMMDSNMGTYVTTNTLLDLVKYDNIIRFDSDDVMKKNMISEIEPFTDEYDAIRFMYDDYIDNKIVINNYSSYPHGVFFYKRKIIDMAGGYQDWVCAADTELLVRLGNRIKQLKIPKKIFLRRIHDNSLTRNKKTAFESEIRNKYKLLIGKNKSLWINKKTNTYKKI